MKTGGDVAKLEADFKKALQVVKQTYGQPGTYRGPVHALRDQVPEAPRAQIVRFDCDPALVLNEDDRGLWDSYVNEAKTVMREFNRALRAAIELDERDAESGK